MTHRLNSNPSSEAKPSRHDGRLFTLESQLQGMLGRVGLNFLLSTAADIAARGIALVYLALLARHLGPAGFGTFNLLQSYLVLLVVVAACGLDRVALRDFALSDYPPLRYFSTVLWLRIVMSVVVGGVLVSVAAYLRTDLAPLLSIIAVASLFAAAAGTYASALQASERFGVLGAAATASAGVLALWATGGVLLQRSLIFFLSGLVFSEAVRAAVLLGATPASGRIPRVFDLGLARKAVRSAAPFALLSILGVIYFRIDMLMLDFAGLDLELGLYAGPFRVLEALAVLPALMLAVLFPRLTRLQRSAPADSARLYLLATRALLWIAVVIGTVGALAAKPILETLFGASYINAVPVLLWLMLAMVFLYWHAPNVSVLFGGHEIGAVVKLSFVTAGANVLLNLLLIPRYGATGAAAATAASEALSLGLFTPVVCRRLGIGLKGYVGGALRPTLRRGEALILLDRNPLQAR